MSLLQNSNAIQTGGYNIANSLRFQSASSQYLSRTPASAGNRTTQTFSFWVKIGDIATTDKRLFSCDGAANDFAIIITANKLFIYNNIASVTNTNLTTTQVFRDPSAWYHVVVVYDTTNATSTERVKLYVNGSQVTAFSTATYPAQNTNTYWNTTNAHSIGRYNTGASQYFDGYMTEINFIDGQALTPSSFGETDTLTGQWVAKSYSGSYGTNGFFLKFANGTSTTTLGSDSSGNGNNWTLNNFTRSAGVSDCWMEDVPSGNGSAGTQPNSNYAVMNPLSNTNGVASNANLTTTVTGAASFPSNVRGTFAVNSGKWYWEQIITGGTGTASCCLGIIDVSYAQNINLETSSANQVFYAATGNKRVGSTLTAYGSSYTTNDVIGIVLDLDGSTITFYKNNVSQGAISLPASTIYTPVHWHDSSANTSIVASNFGQRSFAYTPPSGFKALCTANLPTSTIVKGDKYMDATTYTGTGANGRQVTNQGGFEPGMIWIKNRSSAVNHIWQDTTRGVGASNALRSDTTGAESGQFVDAVNSTGYVVNGDAAVNGSGSSYVGWQWRTSSSTVTNTSGTISSQVRANPTAGVSVVTYTGTGANATVGHGLGVAPKMVIVKNRTGANNWAVYHASLTSAAFYLSLNQTIAQTNNNTLWNSTAPTSSVFSVGTAGDTNGNTNNLVAYCFAEIAGFSKFGSYTGNGSADGVFVYLGFRPKFVMIKRTDTTGNWAIHDTSRSTFNQIPNYLLANTADAEVGGSVLAIDALSNGFKLRVTQANENASGGTYVYACFAESPFASSNAR